MNDFSSLANKDFKEDSVREFILAPHLLMSDLIMTQLLNSTIICDEASILNYGIPLEKRARYIVAPLSLQEKENRIFVTGILGLPKGFLSYRFLESYRPKPILLVPSKFPLSSALI